MPRPISYAVFCLKKKRIYVTRLWYTNPVRPKETLITGVTRDGTFLIEDGVFIRPLVDMRLTVSFFFNDTATTEIYTLSLHDALPIYARIRKTRYMHKMRCLLINRRSLLL